MTDVILFLAYAATSVIGLLLLKHALPLARVDWQAGNPVALSVGLLILGACFYISSFTVWLVILARHELSSAYPAAIGLTLVFSTVGATLLLGESLSAMRLVGIGLIFLGTFFVTRY